MPYALPMFFVSSFWSDNVKEANKVKLLEKVAVEGYFF